MSYRGSLLAVADDPAVLGFVKASLGPEFEVISAASAAEARSILTRRDVDILLADDALQKSAADRGSHLQLLEWVQRQRPATVRILVTEAPYVPAALDAVNRGPANRFLIKPLEAGSLLQTMRDCARLRSLERSHSELQDQLRELKQTLDQRVRERTLELEEANRQLEYKNSILEKMALTDPLTGLPNRRAMDRLIRTELQRRSRTPSPLALLIVDADDFKAINTQFLLPGGDHALVWLAQMLAQTVRAVDSVGRIGGEEFLVLAPATGFEGAVTLAERLRRTVAAGRAMYQNERISVTVSIGAAVVDANSPATYEQLKESAAAALARAKAAGRNRCVVHPVQASEKAG